mmetsp:Transcript_94247/g.186843  ORF Transcript_94247/g.186843 Transcript_94247/m.186843 type:complete len:217 (-) Transcript_94247:78-728(-)
MPYAPTQIALVAFSSLASLLKASTLPAVPHAWPPVFRMVLQRHFADETPSRIIDIYYDLHNGRNLEINRADANNPNTHIVDHWQNTTVYYYDLNSTECKVKQVGVGLLRPNWMQHGQYVGQKTIAGHSCHAWSRGIAPKQFAGKNYTGPFAWYYADVETGSMIGEKFFNGAQDVVLEWHVGDHVASTDFPPPTACFKGGKGPSILTESASGTHFYI